MAGRGVIGVRVGVRVGVRDTCHDLERTTEFKPGISDPNSDPSFYSTGLVYTTSPPITVISGSIFQMSSAGTVM